MKKSLMIALALLLLPLCGCDYISVPDKGLGETTYWDDYYAPRWVANDRIMAVYDVSTTSRAAEVEESVIAEIDINTKAKTELFRIQGTDLRLYLMPSPNGNYVGIIKAGKLGLYDRSGKKLTVITAGEGNIKEFDWSPDETRLVYTDGSKVFLVGDLFGAKTATCLATGESVTWGYGETIYFTESDRLRSVKPDGSSWQKYSAFLSDPQLPRDGAAFIYGQSAYSYLRYDPVKDTSEYLTDKLEYSYGKAFLAPDRARLVLENSQGGIYLFDLNKQTAEKIL